jgi:hypothetical protein
MSWTTDNLKLGQLGAQRLTFRAIAEPLLPSTFFVRERELSYFGIEEWDPVPRIECIAGKGETACIYSVGATADVKPVSLREIFPLVDFVTSTTGAGVGIVGDTKETPSGIRTDLETGRRARIRVMSFFMLKYADDDSTFVLWVERWGPGQGGGSLGGIIAKGTGVPP